MILPDFLTPETRAILINWLRHPAVPDNEETCGLRFALLRYVVWLESQVAVAVATTKGVDV